MYILSSVHKFECYCSKLIILRLAHANQQLIQGGLYSVCLHRQCHKLPGLLQSGYTVKQPTLMHAC